MVETAKEKSGPTVDLQLVQEQCQQQATSKKRAEDEDAAVQDDVATRTRHDVHQVENEIKFLTAEAPDGVDNLIFDARANRILRRLNPAVAAHRQDHRNPCPDAEAAMMQRQCRSSRRSGGLSRYHRHS